MHFDVSKPKHYGHTHLQLVSRFATAFYHGPCQQAGRGHGAPFKRGQLPSQITD